MDPLSDVLAILKPKSLKANGFDVGADWSMDFPMHWGGDLAAIKCYAVAHGDGWLVIDGIAEPVRMVEGDCFLLPLGRSFQLTKDLALPLRDYRELLDVQRARSMSPREGEFYLVGGFFSFDSREAKMLLEVLPPVVHVRNEGDRATLRWSIERLAQELRDQKPGSELVAEHLVQMMLVLALRMHMTSNEKNVGWLSALADRQIGVAAQAIHSEPARGWTLDELAQLSGMSRSSFAQRFKEKVGRSPMEYLTRWRMLLAGDKLMHSGEPVGAIALQLGYESESAFSTAFRRVMGMSPRRYGRGG